MANNEWGTPKKYVESARKVMVGIDIDPASNDEAQKIIGADWYYTEVDDGLAQPWIGTVWLNPPYGRGLAVVFIKKLLEELTEGRATEAIVLTNNVTDTLWFSDTLGKYATAFCFPNHRIQFVAPEGTKKSSNSLGQVFSYFGNDPASFVTEFKQYGLCLLPWRK